MSLSGVDAAGQHLPPASSLPPPQSTSVPLRPDAPAFVPITEQARVFANTRANARAADVLLASLSGGLPSPLMPSTVYAVSRPTADLEADGGRADADGDGDAEPHLCTVLLLLLLLRLRLLLLHLLHLPLLLHPLLLPLLPLPLLLLLRLPLLRLLLLLPAWTPGGVVAAQLVDLLGGLMTSRRDLSGTALCVSGAVIVRSS